MYITMVKKRLANGEPCGKCAQAEEMLRNRGHWDRIDEVVWADESDPRSPGAELGRKHGVDLAPFFVVDQDGKKTVYTSAIKFMKEALGPGSPPAANEVATPPIHSEDVQRLAAEMDAAEPMAILRVGLQHFGADCAISFSGAEDVALIDMAAKSGLPFSAFSLDTGRLHPETYRFIDRVRKHYGIEIQLMSPAAKRLEPFVRQKGLFSFYEDGHEECCSIRKVEPLGRALSNFRAWVTGQRKDQSVTRAELSVFALDTRFSGKADVLFKLNPFANWSSAAVWNYIRDNAVPYNELHDRGFVSIGCEPCTRPLRPGEHERAARWWWEAETQRECGLHIAEKNPGDVGQALSAPLLHEANHSEQRHRVRSAWRRSGTK